MKKFSFCFIALCLFDFLCISRQPAYSWGFFAHQKINRMAIFTLPEAMMGFYKQHIEYITQHAVDPDKRRYINTDEAPRHYIDIDHYGPYAFDSVPHRWKEAIKKYSEDTLDAYGVVPWHIEKMVYRLTEAFKTGDIDQILHNSAELGHYIADAHVPLHTTENYNGQLTNQVGIHGFWESRIPELKSDDYDYWVGRAKYIERPVEEAWNIIKISHSEVDSVLKFEAELNSKYSADKKYSIENRGSTLMKVYSTEYTNDYNNMLDGMVERRMRAAILAVGSMWYTAWVNAGKPDLALFDKKEVSDSLNQMNKKLEDDWTTKKSIAGSGHSD